MKKNILLISIIVFYNISTFAQRPEYALFANYKDSLTARPNKYVKKKNAGAEGRLLPDSIINHKWSTFVSDWVKYAKTIQYFNAGGSDTLEIKYLWDVNKNSYIKNHKTTTTFNSKGVVTNITHLDWNNGLEVWIGKEKYDYAYNSDGDMTNFTLSKWDSNLQQWSEYNKDDYTYDSAGNETNHTSFQWNAGLLQLTKYSKEDYTYDKNGNKTNHTYFYWNANLGKWMKSYKDDYLYNEANKDTSWIISHWNASYNDWVNFIKYKRAYDVKGNEISNAVYNWNVDQEQWIAVYVYKTSWNAGNRDSIVGSDWDPSLNEYVKKNKYAFFYDSQGNRTKMIFYNWSDFSNGWIKSWKEDFLYNENHQMLSIINSIWLSEPDNWLNYFKFTHTYDENGNETSVVRYDWNNFSKDWKVTSNGISTYDNNGNVKTIIYAGNDPFTGVYNNINKLTYFYSNKTATAPLITFSGASLTVGGVALNLKTLFATNSLGMVSYSITGKAAVLTNSNLAAASAGLVTITGYVTSTPAYSDGSQSAVFTIVGIPGIETAIEKIVSVDRLYPNPTNGIVNLKSTANVSVKIFNEHGNEVGVEESLPTISPIQFDLSGLSNGIYYLYINSSNGSVVHKLILAK